MTTLLLIWVALTLATLMCGIVLIIALPDHHDSFFGSTPNLTGYAVLVAGIVMAMMFGIFYLGGLLL